MVELLHKSGVEKPVEQISLVRQPGRRCWQLDPRGQWDLARDERGSHDLPDRCLQRYYKLNCLKRANTLPVR